MSLKCQAAASLNLRLRGEAFRGISSDCGRRNLHILQKPGDDELEHGDSEGTGAQCRASATLAIKDCSAPFNWREV